MRENVKWVWVRDSHLERWELRINYGTCGNAFSTIAVNDTVRHLEGQEVDERRLEHWQFKSETDPREKIPKRVPWDAQDYAKRQIVWLRFKPTLNICTITGIYMEVLSIADHGMSKPFAEISEDYTLPDGTELYKDSE